MEVKPRPKTSGATARGAAPPARKGTSAHLYPAVFVWGIWALLVAGGAAFLVNYHTAIPFGEDWDHMIPWVAGTEPVTPAKLWEAFGEYRPFLLRLSVWGLLRLSGGYYWSLMLFHLVCLAGLSFAMIRESTRSRGWTSYADAFFPLVLLHWVYSYHLYFAETLNQLLPTVVAGVVLLVIVRQGTKLTLAGSLVAGCCLVLLTLCSTYGMVYIPALMTWFIYCGVVAGRSGSPEGRRTALVITALAGATLTLFCLYFVGLALNQRHAEAAPWDRLRAAWGLLTLSWGLVAENTWPYSGYMMGLLAVVAAVALGVEMWRRRALDRAFGLFCFLGAPLTISLAYGWGRGGQGEDPVSFYYYLITVLAPCGLYFVGSVWQPRTAGYLMQMCLFAGMVVAFALNMQDEFRNEEFYWSSKRLWKQQDALEQDIRKGLAPYEILARHRNTVVGPSNSSPEELNQRMHELHAAGCGVFRYMHADPALQRVPLDLKPVEVHDLTWEKGIYKAAGPEPYLTFALPHPMAVVGIHMAGSYTTNPNNDFDALTVAWKTGASSPFPSPPQYTQNFISGWTSTTTFYVADTLDHFRFYPVKNRDFQITEIQLLVPEGHTAQHAAR